MGLKLNRVAAQQIIAARPLTAYARSSLRLSGAAEFSRCTAACSVVAC
jgi:hypothetical protein